MAKKHVSSTRCTAQRQRGAQYEQNPELDGLAFEAAFDLGTAVARGEIAREDIRGEATIESAALHIALGLPGTGLEALTDRIADDAAAIDREARRLASALGDGLSAEEAAARARSMLPGGVQ